MPPPERAICSKDAPSSRCSNSPARLPAYTRWVWQSMSPGVIHSPVASEDGIPCVAMRLLASRAGPIHAMRSPLMASAASRMEPYGPAPDRIVARSPPTKTWSQSTDSEFNSAPPWLALHAGNRYERLSALYRYSQPYAHVPDGFGVDLRRLAS